MPLKRQARSIFPIITVLFLLGSINFIFATGYFIAYGKLYRVNLGKLDVNKVGEFHKTSKYLSVAPNGLVWSRLSLKSIGGVDPVRGIVSARINLPYRPYRIAILENGKACISHQILIKKGIPLSLVDVESEKYLETLFGLDGLVTDMAVNASEAFIATYRLSKPRGLSLYRLNFRKGNEDVSLSKLLENNIADARYEISIYGGILYLVLIPGRNSGVESKITLLNARSGERLGVIAGEALGEVAKLRGKPVFSRDTGYFTCIGEDGRNGIGLLSTKNRRVSKILPVKGKIYRIVSVEGHMLSYMNIQPYMGKGELAIFFYDTMAGKEVKRIRILP